MASEKSELAYHALAQATHGRNGWWRANCPFCVIETGKPDRRASLGIKPTISFAMCFKCGARVRLTGVPDDVVQLALNDEATAPPAKVGKPDEYIPLGTDEEWDAISLETPREYLLARGLPRKTIFEAKLGCCLDGKYAGRIIVPVLAVDERTWRGFSGRDWTDRQELRYRYPPGMQRGSMLYNEAAVYRRTDTPLLVTEGVFDALPYWPDAVASLGKPGDIHRDILCETERPIAVCLDGDAWEEGWILAQYLELQGRRAGFVRLPPRTDPNNVEPGWLKEEAIRCLP